MATDYTLLLLRLMSSVPPVALRHSSRRQKARAKSRMPRSCAFVFYACFMKLNISQKKTIMRTLTHAIYGALVCGVVYI